MGLLPFWVPYIMKTGLIRLYCELTWFWILSDIFLHCVLEVKSLNSTIPECMPWWEPWNASQLITDVPLEPLPASRTQASKPVFDTDSTHRDAGSWIATYLLPWLSVANTFISSPEPWNWVLKETVWQPWLFWEVSVILTFPTWKTTAWKCKQIITVVIIIIIVIVIVIVFITIIYSFVVVFFTTRRLYSYIPGNWSGDWLYWDTTQS